MINQDTPRSIGKVKSYIRSQGYEFLVSLDPNKSTAKKLNGMVMPTLILVDKGGIIKLDISWSYNERSKQIEIKLDQVQDDGYLFEMPVELQLIYDNKSRIEKIFMDKNVYPNEGNITEEINSGNIWEPSSIIEELKVKANNPLAN